MKRIFTLALAFVGFAFSSQSFAALCTSSVNWGSLGPPDTQAFSHSFASSGTYTDCYTFSLSGAADAFGGSAEIDPWFNRLDIDLVSVALFNGGISGGSTTGSLISSDNSPSNFSFSQLALGVYSLLFTVDVDRELGLFSDPVRYEGSISTTARAVAVSEPTTLAIAGLGLAFLGLFVRRQRPKAKLTR